jgi:hypothetical protein
MPILVGSEIELQTIKKIKFTTKFMAQHNSNYTSTKRKIVVSAIRSNEKKHSLQCIALRLLVVLNKQITTKLF